MSQDLPNADRVVFLVWTLDGVGGVARTVINLANEMADRHRVSIISVLRMRENPAFGIDPRIDVTWLIDNRPLADGRRRRPRLSGSGPLWLRLQDKRLSALAGDTESMGSRLTDAVVRRAIRGLREPAVLISTRPILHAAAARWAGPHLLTLGQEHLNFVTRSGNPNVLRIIEESVVHLDSYVVLTEGDRQDYLPRIGDRTRIEAIPNSISWAVDGRVSTLDSKIVVAAGRFEPRKGFLRLIDAYAPLAVELPDWQLHIYGEEIGGGGDYGSRLRARIAERGLEDHVRLMGYSDDFSSVLRSSSVYAMASHYEGLPMVLIEAMSQGLPIVVMDCPRGPAEIVVDGETGVLVPDGDVDGFTEGLRRIMKDDALRRKMGREAERLSHQYEVGAIADRWDRLIEELIEARASAPGTAGRTNGPTEGPTRGEGA